MKKKLIITALVSVFVFGMFGIAEASLVTFSETFLGTPDDKTSVTINDSSSYYFYFDLTSAGSKSGSYYLKNDKGTKHYISISSDDAKGFIPGAYSEITSAVLSYTFYDSDKKSDPVTMSIGGSDPNITLLNDTLTLYKDYATGSLPITASFLNDGKLEIIVSEPDSGSNIKLQNLNLTVQAQTAPLPAAGLLLGSGLIGLIGIRRKTAI